MPVEPFIVFPDPSGHLEDWAISSSGVDGEDWPAPRQTVRKTHRRDDYEQGDVQVLEEGAAAGLRIRLIRLGGPHREAPVVRGRDMRIRPTLDVWFVVADS